jgi:hypothetical protein
MQKASLSNRVCREVVTINQEAAKNIDEWKRQGLVPDFGITPHDGGPMKLWVMVAVVVIRAVLQDHTQEEEEQKEEEVLVVEKVWEGW